MKSKNMYLSDFLFTVPSFLSGAGSVFNIAGNYYSFNYCKHDREADHRALSSDWGMIGLDLENAYRDLEE